MLLNIVKKIIAFRIILRCLGSWRGLFCIWQNYWWWCCPFLWWRRGRWGLTMTGLIWSVGWLWFSRICRGRYFWGRCWCISESIYRVLPVFVIENEVLPQFQWTKSIHYWNDESDVPHQGFLVGLKYTSRSTFMVTPHSYYLC